MCIIVDEMCVNVKYLSDKLYKYCLIIGQCNETPKLFRVGYLTIYSNRSRCNFDTTGISERLSL